MKKLITLAILLPVATTNAQYNKSSIEGEIGGIKLRDITSTEVFNYDLAYRLMLNTKFGAKLSINYTNIQNTNINYQSASFMGVANAGRIMGFEEFAPWYTILVGVGGNYSYNESQVTNDLIYHRLSNFHLAGFVDNEFRITDGLFIKLGLDVITGVNSRPFNPIENATQTTSILNFNAGVVIPLGKHKEYADFYLEPKRKDTVIERIIEKPAINNYYTQEVKEELFTDYVQFAYDSFKLEKGSQALATIKNAAEVLKTDQVVVLTGFASPENGTGLKDYNKNLAIKRAETVKSYLISLGINEKDIVIIPAGSKETVDGNNIDLSRSVRIEVSYYKK